MQTCLLFKSQLFQVSPSPQNINIILSTLCIYQYIGTQVFQKINSVTQCAHTAILLISEFKYSTLENADFDPPPTTDPGPHLPPYSRQSTILSPTSIASCLTALLRICNGSQAWCHTTLLKQACDPPSGSQSMARETLD